MSEEQIQGSENQADPAPVHREVIESIDWIYEHLVCEFDHWDVCITGLVEFGGAKWFCNVIGDTTYNCNEAKYRLQKVDWTPECEEYLSDYRKAYHHWFHEGKPRCQYDGRPLKWFSDKWKKRNPIADQVSR